jgi:hypothetical protein
MTEVRTGGARRRRAPGRLVAVALLLAGVFAMHGLSAAAGGACPAGGAMVAASGPAMAAAAVTVRLALPDAHRRGSKLTTVAADGHGLMCVATLPRSGLAALVALLAAALAVFIAVAATGGALQVVRIGTGRAPPSGKGSSGKELLLQVGVSRT